MVMANGFNELNVNEMMEVDGGFGILMTLGVYLGLGLLALGPAAVAVEAIDNSLDEDRERGRRDGIIKAREDYENGFTEGIYNK